ncbi:S41 family peptidase [Maricaulis sp.]|uniref:S41 family peptidase n=1 Tax=Maricaulis sp. TaxID=1486257 RepID=UPI00262C0A79|nr:S41 family peptidase [Maricaulis sp.]
MPLKRLVGMLVPAVKAALAAVGLGAMIAAASAQSAQSDFRPVVEEIEALIQEHHFNAEELEGEGYRRTMTALRELGETASSREAFLDGFRAIWADGPFSHVNLTASDADAASMSAYFDSMNAGAEATDLSWNGRTAILSVHTMMGQDTIAAIETAFRDIAAQDAEAVIIDLRQNEGGAFAMRPIVSGLIDEPLDAGFFISRRWTDHNAQLPGATELAELEPWSGWSVRAFWADIVERAVIRVRFQPGEAVFGGPVYVLTSGQTASAAEMAVEALQSAGRVEVVGEATAGEMLSQQPFDLPGGMLLFLPIADYYSRHTGRIEGQPITPDVPADADAALDRALALIAEARHGDEAIVR